MSHTGSDTLAHQHWKDLVYKGYLSRSQTVDKGKVFKYFQDFEFNLKIFMKTLDTAGYDGLKRAHINPTLRPTLDPSTPSLPLTLPSSSYPSLIVRSNHTRQTPNICWSPTL